MYRCLVTLAVAAPLAVAHSSSIDAGANVLSVSEHSKASLVRKEAPAEAKVVAAKKAKEREPSGCDWQGSSFNEATLEQEMASIDLTKEMIAVPNVWQHVTQLVAARHTDATQAPTEELEMLGRALMWRAKNSKKRSLRTVETGFAHGSSALALLATAMGSGLALQHSAFDPYEDSDYHGDGSKAVEELYARVKGVNGVKAAYAVGEANVTNQDTASLHQKSSSVDSVGFNLVKQPAAVGLGDLVKANECIDVAFMDDGHKFDDNMAELWFMNKLMPPGGVLILDDAWMPSVKATVSFIETNLPFKRLNAIKSQGAVFVKKGADERTWTHFKTFATPDEAVNQTR